MKIRLRIKNKITKLYSYGSDVLPTLKNIVIGSLLLSFEVNPKAQ